VAADRRLAAAWLFGAVSILQLHAQAMGLPVPPQLMSALPQPRHRRGADRDFATGPQGAGGAGFAGGRVRAGPVMAGEYRPINCYVCANRLCSGIVTAISMIGAKGDWVHLYRPKFVLAALQPPQDRLLSKLGGQPWGFPQNCWPVCPGCDNPMSMVAQLAHTLPVIDLGRAGSVLHLFFCANVACRTYGDIYGCRAMILQCQEIGNGVTLQPADKDAGQSINGELWIVAWDRHEDAVTPEQAPLFYDDRSHLNLPDEIAQPFGFDERWNTKAGGVPYWTGGGVTLDRSYIPCPPFEFLLQIHSRIYVDGAPPAADLIDCRVSIYEEVGSETKWNHTRPTGQHAGSCGMSLIYENGADSYGVDFVNFGSDGTAFVFIDRLSNPPEVRWHWNR